MPVRPPPGPVTPGSGAAGPGCSLQQAVASAFGPLTSASSKVTISRPSLRNAGEWVIFGTQVDRKASMLAPAVGGSGLADARDVVAVAAEVRGDEAEVGRGGDRLADRWRARWCPSGPRPAACPLVDPSGTTRESHRPWSVDDRVEVDERVVPGGVAVTGDGPLGLIDGAHRRVAADRGLTGRVVPHVLHVALPREVGGVQLVGDRRDLGGEDASRPGDLAARRRSVVPAGKSANTWQSVWLVGLGAWPETRAM